MNATVKQQGEGRGVAAGRVAVRRWASRASAVLATLLAVSQATAQPAVRKLAETDLSILGLTAAVEPPSQVVPKLTPSGVRIVVRSGGRDLSLAEVADLVGPGFTVKGELSGPGLARAITLPDALDDTQALSPDAFLLPLPPLGVSGDYELRNVRIESGGRPVLDVGPEVVSIKVIERILITSLKTRALTMDEIKEKGIVLDQDDYLGFEFTLGLALESKVVNLTFPVVFDPEGVVMPEPQADPTIQIRRSIDLTIDGVPFYWKPVLLDVPVSGGQEQPKLPNGEPIRIPSLLVIPGNVGYLKQFFSAQLYVANGAPAGANLTVHEVHGTMNLPLGDDRYRGINPQTGRNDDPLAPAELSRDGATITQPMLMDVRGVGPDGVPGTDDDVDSFGPGEQGQAEFLLRGEREGFHAVDLDIHAVLEGLPTGPVTVTGKATGGVLVRNAKFDMTFTVPNVVRTRERFKVYASINNIGQGAANGVTVTLDAMQLSGVRLLSSPTISLEPIAPGDAQTIEFEFESLRTGQVVASYLKFESDDGSSAQGALHFTLGVGERGVPLSPDTLVLPASVDLLPGSLVDAAMRVLGQAWSIATARQRQLPMGVIAIDRAVVTQKALALAEAGLRVSLGELPAQAVRDLILDFYGGQTFDAGFDQLLRQTEAGRGLASALGEALDEPARSAGLLPYERDLAQIAASGPDFVSLAVGGLSGGVDVVVTDGDGHSVRMVHATTGLVPWTMPGGVLLPAGGADSGAVLGFIGKPGTGALTLTLSGPAEASLTVPQGAGSYLRVHGTSQGPARLILDPMDAGSASLQEDADADGTFETTRSLNQEWIQASAPIVLAANMVGPEMFAGSSPFGLHAAVVFDRVVDLESAGSVLNYRIPDNRVTSARRQLSGRLVFLALQAPEGPYLPTTLSVDGVTDGQGLTGSTQTVPLGSLLQEAGGVVTGRVVQADGTPVPGATVYYGNHLSDASNVCWDGVAQTLSALTAGGDGTYELRYVRRDPCGFDLSVQDSRTTAIRTVSGRVRNAGERLVIDIALIGAGSVGGVVRDITGAPVTGADVLVTSGIDEGNSRFAATDAQGRYLVTGLTVGPVSVKAAKGIGLGRGAGRIERAGLTAAVDVTLDAGSVSVSGRFTRLENGVATPEGGVLIAFTSNDGLAGYAWTDRDGRYSIEGMPVGPFGLYGGGASLKGQAFAYDRLENLDLVFIVPPETIYGVVRGIVTLPGGVVPAAGVVVAEDLDDLAVTDRGLNFVVTGAEGTYEIGGLPVNVRRTLRASTRDRKRTGSASYSIDPETRLREGVDIELSGLGTAEFTVLDPAGVPIPRQEVGLLGTCNRPCGCAFLTTDDAGRVRFEDQPLGQVAVKAKRSFGGLQDVATSAVTIRANGETAYGIVRFVGGGTISAKVLSPSGVEIKGGEYTVRSSSFNPDYCILTNDISHKGKIDINGNSFRVSGVGVGPVSVTVSNPFAPTPVSKGGVIRVSGDLLEMQLQFSDTTAGFLSGRILLPDGVTPAGAGVEVKAHTPAGDVIVVTDPNGHYGFADVLPAGQYVLTATDAASGGTVQDIVSLRAGQDLSHDMRLKGRGTVRVHVVDPLGQALETAYVTLRELDHPKRAQETVLRAADDGWVSFTDIYEGNLSVLVSDPYQRGGRAAAVISKPGETVEVTVELNATGTVRGRFLTSDGASPIPYALVRLLVNGRAVGEGTTQAFDEVGGFSFDFVPMGSIRVELKDPLTLRTGKAEGSLASQGEELYFDVMAQGLGTVRGIVSQSHAGGDVEPEPLATVRVDAGLTSVATAADYQGFYTVSGIPLGDIRVSAGLGYAQWLSFAGSAQAVLASESVPLDLDVRMHDSGEVQVQVLEWDGVTKAKTSKVDLMGVPPAAGEARWREQRDTDDAGAVEFQRVPTGPVTGTAKLADSIDRGTATKEVPPGVVHMPILLTGLGNLAVTTQDASSTRVGGDVVVSGPGQRQQLVATAGSPTTFHELFAGLVDVTLRATSPDGRFTLYGQASAEVLPGQTVPVTVTLSPLGTVKGCIVRPTASADPARGTLVRLTSTSTTSNAMPAAATAEAQGDGCFSFVGVPVGRIRLSGQQPIIGGILPEWQDDLTTQGQVLDAGTLVLDEEPPTIAFVLPTEGSVTQFLAGKVRVVATDSGSGIRPETVQVAYPTGAVQWGPYLTREGDEFWANLVSSALVVGPNRLVARVTDKVGRVGEAAVAFTVAGGRLHGRVTRGDNSPVPLAAISIGSTYRIYAAATGAYSQSGLMPGRYTVTATDPVSGLSTSGEATLTGGGDVQLDLQLPLFGVVKGTVVHPSDDSAAVGVKVTLGGRSAVTDATGAFDLGAVASGTHAITALATNGDRASSMISVPTPGDARLTLNGMGSVDVTVRTGAGATVAGAQVSLRSSSPFGGQYSAGTSSAGVASFPFVLAGNLTIEATYAGLKSVPVPAVPLTDGQIKTPTVRLQTAVTLDGHVYSNDGVTAVIGAEVTVSGAKSANAVTGANGRYNFNLMPPGTYQLQAKTAAGDRGKVAATIGQDGQVVPNPTDVVLIGIGAVEVTVETALHQPVAAAVWLTSSGPLGGLTYKLLDATGKFTFEGILAGPIDILATDFSTNARGEWHGTLDPGETERPVVTLQAVSTISGHIYRPFVAPAEPEGIGGVVVCAQSNRCAETDGSGFYTIGNLVAGTYFLEAKVGGKVRARSGSVLLGAAAKTVDLTLIWTSRVEGTVWDWNGAVTAGATVTLTSRAGYDVPRSMTTAADGLYGFEDVPAGSIEVDAVRGPDRSPKGTLDVPPDGATVTHPLTLVQSVVSLPATLYDANSMMWQVQPNGALLSEANFDQTTPRLEVEREGVVSAFVGTCPTPCIVRTEEDKREVVLEQTDLAGLVATRKVFVPREGYFARYLDVLQNPPDATGPVTMTVRLRTGFQEGGYVLTSAPDTDTVDREDQWIVTDDSDSTNIYQTSDYNSARAPIAYVFAGTDGTRPDGVSLASPALVTTEWTSVLIPGQTAAFLTLTSIQADQDRARQAAERLAALPPEAMVGLSTEEARAVVNFVVPADLRGTVPPLPANDGQLAVRVLAGDGESVLGYNSATTVMFETDLPYYGKPVQGYPGSEGPALFVPYRPGTGAWVNIPRAPFGLAVTSSQNGTALAVSATESGDFPSTDSIDLTTLSGAGLRASSSYGGLYELGNLLDGKLSTLWLSSSGDSAQMGKAPFVELELPKDARIDSIVMTGPPGARGADILRARFEVRDGTGSVVWSLDSDLTNGGGSVSTDGATGRLVRITSLLDNYAYVALADLRILGTADLGPTGRVAKDVILRRTAVLKGEVRRADGTPVYGAEVTVTSQAGTAPPFTVPSSGSSTYSFVALPEGDYDVTATVAEGGASVGVHGLHLPAQCDAEDGRGIICRATVQPLIFPAMGSVTVWFKSDAGIGLPGWVALNGTDGFARTRWSNGSSLTFGDVPFGSYTASATDERNGVVVSRTFEVLPGGTPPVTLQAPPVSTLSVLATLGGETASGVELYWQSSSRPTEWILGTAVADGMGRLNMAGVPGPSARVQARWTRSGRVSVGTSEQVAIGGEGDVVPVEVDAPGFGAVTGRLSAVDNKIVEKFGVEVAVKQSSSSAWATTTTTAGGQYVLADLPVGDYVMRTSLQEAYGGSTRYGRVFTAVQVANPDVTATFDAPVSVGPVTTGHVGIWEVRPKVWLPVTVLALGQAYGAGEIPALPKPRLEILGPNGEGMGASANGEMTFTPTSAGSHYVIVTDANGAAGGYRLLTRSSADDEAFRPYAGRYASGTVTVEGGGVLSTGTKVLAAYARGSLWVAPNSSGAYRLPLLGTGTVRLEVLGPDGVPSAYGTASADDGQDHTVDLVLPEREHLTVSVKRGTTALSGIAVTVRSNHPNAVAEDAERHLVTGADGMTAEVVMPVGQITIEVADPLNLVTYTEVQQLALGTRLDAMIVLPDVLTVFQGTVTARDGSTPLPGTQIRAARGYDELAVAIADAEGRYSLQVSGRMDISLQSYFASETGGDGYAWIEPVTPPGGTATQDFRLEVAVLEGHVSVSNGAGDAAGALVRACYLDDCRERMTDGGGSFCFLGLPSWGTDYWGTPSDVTALVRAYASVDAVSFATATFPYNVRTTETETVSLTLPRTQGVDGHVLDADSQPVPGAQVTIEGPSGELATVVAGDAEHDPGHFEFAHVAPGSVRLFAADGDDIPGEARATVVVDTVNLIDVQLVPAATINVSLTGTEGQLSQPVDVAALDAPVRVRGNPATVWTKTLVTKDAGEESLRVPTGEVRVVFDGGYDEGQGQYVEQSAFEAVLAKDETRAVALVSGSHTTTDHGLVGSAAAYCFSASGYCPDGPTPAPTVSVSDAVAVEPLPRVVAPDLEGQAYSTLLVRGESVRVRQRYYVPASGAFARVLTIVENPTTSTAAVTLDVRHSLGHGDVPVVASSSGDATLDDQDAWVVFSLQEGFGAVVMGVPEQTTTVECQEQSEIGLECSLRNGRNVTLAPAQRRTHLLYYVSGSDQTAVEEEARNLFDLGAADAVTGLTDEELAAVVNLRVPPPPGANVVSGIVSGPQGLVPTARVIALWEGWYTAGEGTTGSDGAELGTFSLPGIPDGEVTLLAVDPVRNRPGRTSVVVPTAGPVEVRLLSDAEVGTVVVRLASAVQGVAGTEATVRTTSYGALWSATDVVDDDGVVTFTGVPAGEVTVSTELGQMRGTLEAGGRLELVRRSGPGSVSVLGTVQDADGSPRSGIRVFASQGGTAIAEATSVPGGAFELLGLVDGECYDGFGGDPATGRGTEPMSFCVGSGYERPVLVLLPDDEGWPLKVKAVFESTGLPAVGLAVTVASDAVPAFWRPSTVLDAYGEATFGGLPAGHALVRVASMVDVGWGNTVLPSVDPNGVTVAVGPSTALPVDLTGANGISYAVDRYGELLSTVDYSCDPMCDSPAYVGVVDYGQGEDVGKQSLDARQIQTLPWWGALEQARRIFVPPSGRYVRLLDVFRNPSDGDLPLSMEFRSWSGSPSDGSTGWTVTATSSGDTAVSAEDDTVLLRHSDPAARDVGFVLSGPGARAVRSTSVWDTSQLTNTWNNVTVPAHGTVILMHFLVERSKGQEADLQSQVQDLVTLLDPDALAGLTPEERSAITNFDVPRVP